MSKTRLGDNPHSSNLVQAYRGLEHDPSQGLVTTTLSAAITFVEALELREQAAFLEGYRDSSVWEEGKAGRHMEKAK